MLRANVDLSAQIGPGPLLDLDLLPNGQWLGVIDGPNGKQLLFDGSPVRVRVDCAFPVVRWLGNSAAVLMDARIDDPGAPNAWVIDRTGDIRSAFAAGDGIQDVLASPEHIVVTYFDDGVFGSPGPNQQGIAVFSADGTIQVAYASDIGTPDIADCYCACWISRDEFAFVPYTDFPFVRFDLGTRRPTLIELPKPVHGASAVTVRGPDAVFWSSYQHKNALLRWTIGSNDYEVLGTHSDRLRGLRGGTLLSMSSAGYTLLDPLDQRVGHAPNRGITEG